MARGVAGGLERAQARARGGCERGLRAGEEGGGDEAEDDDDNGEAERHETSSARVAGERPAPSAPGAGECVRRTRPTD